MLDGLVIGQQFPHFLQGVIHQAGELLEGDYGGQPGEFGQEGIVHGAELQLAGAAAQLLLRCGHGPQEPLADVLHLLLPGEPEEAGDGQEDDGDDEKQEEGAGTGGYILVILILGVCAAGICYCLKTAKARKELDSAEEESLEFYNDYEERQGDSPENEE